MASKRTAESESELKAPKNKRPKIARTDPSSGQRGAFGDLGSATTAPTGDSDLDCEDDSEALAYLRSVRTQASTIPHVLAAKKAGPSPPPRVSEGNSTDPEQPYADRTIYENGVGDFRGYYQDGAYIARPENGWDEDGDNEGDDEDYEEDEHDEAESDNSNERDASESAEDRPHNSSVDEIRDAYIASITNRYIALRKLLQAVPPDDTVAALPATNPTEVGEWKRGADTFWKWEGRLRGTDPLPAQVAAMHKDSVFRLLRVLLGRRFLRTKTQLHERTSRWIWALLARLPEKGELDYMEVGWIRELGKRAVLLMVSLTELEVLREHYDAAGSSPGDQDEYEVGVDVDDCFDDDLSQDVSIDAANAPTPDATEERAGGTYQSSHASANATHEANNTPMHAQCPDDTSDVEMQLDSDMEDEEVAGELPSPPHSDPIADIETAKARLLAQLNNDIIGDDEIVGDDISEPATPVFQLASAVQSTTSGRHAAHTTAMGVIGEGEEEEEEGEYYDMAENEEDTDYERYHELDRAKANERATLNMILTVAGEFYGQRDLLEFRDPFGGL
ncbi:hypothetical protein NUW58_g5385 [Xylaria curta]|uniref:Uncharacterized protein n=1 Tax=Xylaria curta TaxID=42375 RepID=A0ACC1P338_9PEZI|nr:hypothetical protein NUW58_g5385 [Xylaria curta]